MTMVTCEPCEGRGWRNGLKPGPEAGRAECRHCEGVGSIPNVQAAALHAIRAFALKNGGETFPRVGIMRKPGEPYYTWTALDGDVAAVGWKVLAEVA